MGRPGGQIGLILSCCGVGAVTGSLLSPHIVKRVSVPVILLGIGVGWSLVLLVFAVYVSPWLTAALLTLLMTLSPAAGVTVGQALIGGTPRELLGRVNAVTGMMLSGLGALGPFAAGALFQALGTAGSWLALAALTLAATALGWLPLRATDSLTPAPDPLASAAVAAREFDLVAHGELADEDFDVIAHGGPDDLEPSLTCDELDTGQHRRPSAILSPLWLAH